MSTPSSLFALGPSAFKTTFTDFMSAVLTVNNSGFEVKDFSLVPGAAINDHNSPVSLEVEFSVIPSQPLAYHQVRNG